MMAGLQRSTTSFRRQGSSGLVWDDKLLSGELNKLENREKDDNKSTNLKNSKQQEIQVKDEAGKKASSRTESGSFERSRSNGGGRNYRTGRVSPAIEPPSPKVSACGFCSAFSKHQENALRRPPKSGKRKM